MPAATEDRPTAYGASAPLVRVGDDDRRLIAALVGPVAAARLVSLPVREVLEADAERLAGMGLGPVARRRLLAGAELARRFQPAFRPPAPVGSARHALALLSHVRDTRSEVLVVLPLDARLGALGGPVRVAQGAVAHVGAEPREVFAPAVERRAAAVVLAHNHPSGIADPSEQDIAFTRTMVESGRVLGITVLDHLVVTRRSYFSFHEAGLLPEEARP
jgi:DNA repair protein RadC